MVSKRTSFKPPPGLGPRGTALWKTMTSGYPLLEKRPAELLLLEEACRIADRLEKLDELLRGDADCWARVQTPESGDLVLKIDGALSEARQQANQLKQLIAALRLPDEATQKRPQVRGTPRGGYKTTGGAGSVSSLTNRLRESG